MRTRCTASIEEQPVVTIFLCLNVGCGPRESKDGGECIYNCSPKGVSFCRVEFVDPRSRNGPHGNLRGLCFKNKACHGTPKACVDCNLKCEGYSGDCSATTSTHHPYDCCNGAPDQSIL